MLNNEGYAGNGYDTKSQRLEAAAAGRGPRGLEPFQKDARTAHEVRLGRIVALYYRSSTLYY